jgi:hypothetical protein
MDVEPKNPASITFNKRKNNLVSFLKDLIGPFTITTRQELGSYTHLFSHIHKKYTVEWWEVECDLENESSISNDYYTKLRWVESLSLSTEAIPTALKKAEKLYDARKKKKTIDSFFKRK